VRKIAAGEAVEGPHSVVKELLENSIDAGSTAIDISIEESGFKRIFIRDDGEGIHSDDLGLAVANHATSKIGDARDIDGITTFGFRGEALSSMAAVSHFTIMSRTRDQEIGSKLTVTDVNRIVNDYAGPAGTSVIVENLFYNVPARKKFLKSAKSEGRLAREAFLRIAMAHHDIAFSFEADGRGRMELPKTTRELRLKDIYGRDILENLINSEVNEGNIYLNGYFSRPHFLTSSRSMQLLYINNRPVEYRYYGYLLSRAYGAMVPRGKYPAGIIFMDISFDQVDVNVHPAKREVRLTDQRNIDSLIMSIAAKALDRPHSIDDMSYKTSQAPLAGFSRIHDNVRADALPSNKGGSTAAQIYRSVNILSPAHDSARANGQFDSGYTPTVREIEGLYREIGGIKNYSILGLIFGVYLVVQKDDILSFIDVHAAHERMIYDRLMAKSENSESQILLSPAVVECSIEYYAIIVENIKDFEQFGFDIEDFGDNSIIIRSVPVSEQNADPADLLFEIAEAVRGDIEIVEKRHKIASALACRAAKRSGDSIGIHERHELVELVNSGEFELRCPHGRPFVFTLEKNDLEKLFKRQL
jgi:DNA mismatch repair protein MutL